MPVLNHLSGQKLHEHFSLNYPNLSFAGPQAPVGCFALNPYLCGA
jgi:hypothetical protein